MNPLVMMAIYTVVFSVIFPQPEPDYAILLLAAYLPFFFFQTAVSFGVPTLVSNAGLIKKVYFPRELLPLSMTTASFVNFLVTMALLIPAAAYARGGVNGWAMLALIPVAASFLLATAGLVMLLAALNVYFRDVEFLSGVVLTVLFYLTPIVYTLHFVEARSPRVALWIGRNPLTRSPRPSAMPSTTAWCHPPFSSPNAHSSASVDFSSATPSSTVSRGDWRKSCERDGDHRRWGLEELSHLPSPRDHAQGDDPARSSRRVGGAARRRRPLLHGAARPGARCDRAKRRRQVDASQDARSHPDARSRAYRDRWPRLSVARARRGLPPRVFGGGEHLSLGCVLRDVTRTAQARASTPSSSSPSSGALPTIRQDLLQWHVRPPGLRDRRERRAGRSALRRGAGRRRREFSPALLRAHARVSRRGANAGACHA